MKGVIVPRPGCVSMKDNLVTRRLVLTTDC